MSATNKIASIHQPNFIPWLGYFYKIKCSNVFIILDNVEFQSGNASSITNRCKIKTQAGESFFTAPVLKSQEHNINQKKIDWKQPWLKKQWRTIEMSYAKAPFKEQTLAFFHPLLHTEAENLAAYNNQIIKALCAWLELPAEIYIASELPPFSDDKNLRLIEMCKYFQCNEYLSGNGARKYNDEEMYKANQVELTYVSYNFPAYPQLHGEFIAGLSMLDVMMMNSKEQILEFLK